MVFPDTLYIKKAVILLSYHTIIWLVETCAKHSVFVPPLHKCVLTSPIANQWLLGHLQSFKTVINYYDLLKLYTTCNGKIKKIKNVCFILNVINVNNLWWLINILNSVKIIILASNFENWLTLNSITFNTFVLCFVILLARNKLLWQAKAGSNYIFKF